VITLDIGPLEVVEQTSTLRDHLQQAAPRMVIFLMGFEMLGELVDARAEQRDLNLRRARISLVGTELRHYLFFCFFC